MSNGYTLWCFVERNKEPFEVSCSNVSIDGLKEVINKRLNYSFFSGSFILWKVCYFLFVLTLQVTLL